jgi:tetratricopeptide (TPR) repeat protein
MMSRKLFIFLPMLLLVLASCSRDPKVRAQRYVDNGNKFFAREKYKDASIMYRRALREDARSGEAHYRLALTALKLGAYGDAYGQLQRAVELEPENADAKVKLADINLLAAAQDPQHSADRFSDATDLAAKLLKQDPKSFDGHRITGQISLMMKDPAAALPEFQAANDVKPLQPEVVMPYFQALTAADRFPDAEKLAEQLIAKDKTYTPIYELLFSQYVLRRKMDDAERILKLEADNNPKSAVLLLRLAYFYMMTNRRKPEAEAVFTRLTDEKQHPDGHLLAGDFFFQKVREYDRARAEYEAAIAAFPKDKATYQKRLVELFAATGNNAGANQLLAGILKDNPKDSQAIALRAAFMLTTGDRNQINMAVNDLQSLVSKSPENAVFRFQLAEALMAKGDLQQAAAALEQAIKIRPDFVRAHEVLADLYFRLGDNPKALKAAGDILDGNKSNLTGHLVRSEALLSGGDRPRAREELDYIIKNYPQNQEARYQVAYLDFLERDFKASHEMYSKLLQEDPKDPQRRGLRGVTETLAAEGRLGDAVKLIQSTIEAEPGHPELSLMLANLEVRGQQYEPATKIYQDLLDKDPKNEHLLYLLGETYRLKGDLNSATDAYRRASQAAPNDAAPLLQLALLMDGTGRADQAQPIYERILQMVPDNPVSLNNLAFLKAEKGVDLDSAQSMALRASQQAPNSPEITDTLGWIYIKRNRSEEAVRLFQDLNTKVPDNPKFHYHFGMALYQKGDKNSAKRELETALKDKPSKADEAQIRDLLGRL